MRLMEIFCLYKRFVYWRKNLKLCFRFFKNDNFMIYNFQHFNLGLKEFFWIFVFEHCLTYQSVAKIVETVPLTVFSKSVGSREILHPLNCKMMAGFGCDLVMI